MKIDISCYDCEITCWAVFTGSPAGCESLWYMEAECQKWDFSHSEAWVEPAVPEYARIAYSRLRLSSHRLRIKSGTDGQEMDFVPATKLYRQKNTFYCNALWLGIFACPMQQPCLARLYQTVLFNTTQNIKALCLFCHSVLNAYDTFSCYIYAYVVIFRNFRWSDPFRKLGIIFSSYLFYEQSIIVTLVKILDF